MDRFIVVDGAHKESGGQIVRTSLSLSSLTGIPLKIHNIRAGRDNPGMRPQHVAAARAVRSICRGSLEGAEEESMELTFIPGKTYGGKYEFNIGTAGSAVLLAQTILPLLFSASKRSKIIIKGGTNVPKAPTYEYFENIFLPALSLFGLEVKCSMGKAGYFPKGGGEIILETVPGTIKPVSFWPRESIPRAIISLSELPLHIAMREKKVFLNKKIDEVYIRQMPSLSMGNSVLLYRGFVGASVLGKKGVRAESVAQEAVGSLEAEGDVDVDHLLADQLLIYAALAGETSFKTSSVSNHTETNMGIIEKFLERKFVLDGTVVAVE